MRENPAAGADRAIQHLRALLRLDTRNPPGNERPAIDYVAGVLRKAGLAPELFEPRPGRANLVCRLVGTGKKDPLLLTSHVDVVAVEEDRWTHPPFGAEVADGCIWGRGTLDMKGMTAFELETFLALHQNPAPRDRDVILLVLSDEEDGMEWGSTYMTKTHPEKIRAEYALNEVGGFSLPLAGRRLYPIQTAEKGHAWFELTAHGDPGHGSIPHRKNAVQRLTQAVEALGRRPLRHRVHPAARGFLETTARALGGVRGRVIRGLLHPLTARASLALLFRADPDRAAFFQALVFQTATPTMLLAGEKANVIPSTARAVLDGRFTPDLSSAEYLDLVRDVVGPEVDVRPITVGEPSGAPIDTPLYRHLAATISLHDPDGIPCPWLTVGYTDSSNLAKLGTKCYGFYPLQLPPEIQLSKLIHGHDERVPVQGYRWGFHVFSDAVRAFVTGEERRP